MAAIREIVFDCERPSKLACFWAGVLDGYDVRAYDSAEIERLASLGLTPETDPTVAVDGPGPILFFQQVPEHKSTKNRVHLDVEAASRHEEVARLVALGASVRKEFDGRTLMQDPEGNEFCVTEAR
ncbi:VOC family protein [Actinopolymorpha alba]|uniref:VOC family protein n=1 Tax=Actinopolymorpha alba TaxID=533267 RepID=UPI00036ADE47|nr:VOC family protein [Actinopolymorpha alba]